MRHVFAKNVFLFFAVFLYPSKTKGKNIFSLFSRSLLILSPFPLTFVRVLV